MSDFDRTTAALEGIEADLREIFAPPKPPEPEPEPRSEVEGYAKALHEAQSRWVDAPAGWLG